MLNNVTNNQWHTKNVKCSSQLPGLKNLENKRSVMERTCFHGIMLLASQMGPLGHCTNPIGYSYFILYPCAICFCKEMICSEILVLFHSATDLSSQGYSSSGFEMWMWMSVWAAPSGHVCVLTFSLPCFPVSPLSMIHRFLRPFSLHPIDGFQSYLNFKVLMRCSSGQGSALLTYRLYKVTVREGEKKPEHLSGCIALLFLSITKAMILF